MGSSGAFENRKLITRLQLYDLVWATPMVELAKQFQLSDNGLRKICRKYEIPVPKMGYWQKIRYGKLTQKTPLPTPEKQESISIVGSGDKEKIEPVLTLKESVVVPGHISKFHPLIKQTKRLFAEGRKDNGRLSICRGHHGLDIRVSPQQLTRAYRIMDTILKGLELRGAKAGIKPENEWRSATYVSIEGEKVSFGLDESLHTVKVEPKYSWDSGKGLMPNGKLLLRINDNLGGHRSKWSEGKKGKIEDKLASFINGLFVAAAYLKKERQEREERSRKWREEEEERQRKTRALEEEKQKLQVLEQQVAAWQKSRALRAFVRAAVRKVKTYEPDSKFGKWVEWAITYADRNDPLRELKPSAGG